MTLLTYQDVLDNINIDKSSLLLGNGFSMAFDPKRFSFTSLLERAKESDLIKKDSNLNKLFNVFDTTDFEKIIRVLDNYIVTAQIYNPDLDIDKLKDEVENLKTYLVDTITNNHPDKITTLTASESSHCINFIKSYDKIYTLNYDLLLYWVSILLLDNKNNIEDLNFNPEDGFINSNDFPDFLEFNNTGGVSVKLLHLHGGLHLYDMGHSILKIAYSKTNVPLKDQILENLNNNIYPIFISEGTSSQKLEKIIHNPYLNHCYRSLKAISNDIVIFGTGLKRNDEHIASAIINSKCKNIFIGVSSEDKMKEWNIFISNIEKWNLEAEQKTGRGKKPDKKNTFFFDYNTVDIWGRNNAK